MVPLANRNVISQGHVAPASTALNRSDYRDDPERVRRSASDFEAQVLSQMLRPMFTNVTDSKSAFGGGAGEEMWKPMLIDAFAKTATRAGGVGLTDSVLREMLRMQGAHGTSPEAELAMGSPAMSTARSAGRPGENQ